MKLDLDKVAMKVGSLRVTYPSPLRGGKADAKRRPGWGDFSDTPTPTLVSLALASRASFLASDPAGGREKEVCLSRKARQP